MKRTLTYILIVLLGGSFFTVSSYLGENKFYPVYRTLYDYRRLSPELFPSSFTLKLLSVGHFTTYANMEWVKLIQFVGDNIGNNLYLDFSHKILKNITYLSPYFDEAYELDLLFTPLVYADSKDEITTDEREKIERAIEHGKEGMRLICDEEKIEKISATPYGNELWSRTDLVNPCKNGMIPYYIAFHYSNDFGMNTEASYYYKIASMQTNAPEASKFLGPLALANTKDPLSAAISLLFISREGYDKEPFLCKKYADGLLQYLSSGPKLELPFIESIQTFENGMETIKDESVLEAFSATNCNDNLRRAIKQVYLAYVTQESINYPEIVDGKVLLEQGVIPFIPTISTQSGYNVKKIEGRWNFRSY